MMKKILVYGVSIFLFQLFVAASAWSVPMDYYLDLNGQGVVGFDNDGVTGLMSQVSFVQNSEIVQQASGVGGTLAAGDTFTENGVGYADGYSFVSSTADDEGLNSVYELTFGFSGLAGSVTSFGSDEVTFDFNGVGTVSAYLSYIDRTPNIDINDPKPLSEYSNYDNGKKIGEFSIISGTGNLFLSGSEAGNGATFLTLKPIDDIAYYGIWYDENDVDIFDDLVELTMFFVDTTQTALESTPGFPTNGTTEYTFLATGNGGMRADVVPEPSTFLLLGGGLLGLGFYARRKKQ